MKIDRFNVGLISMFILFCAVGVFWAYAVAEMKTKPKSYPLRDYQIDITDSFTYIYQLDRLVDSIPFDKDNSFDKVFLKDNQ